MEFISLNTYIVLYSAIAFATLTVGSLIFKRDTKKLSNVFFFLTTIAIALWIISFSARLAEFMLIKPENFNEVLPYVIGGIVPMLLFFFAFTFTRNRIRISNRSLTFILAPYAFFSAVLYFWPQLIVTFTEGEIERGPIYWIYFLYVLTFFLLSLNLLFKRYKASAGVFQGVLRSLLYAVAVGGSGIFLVGLIYEFTYLEVFRLIQFTLILILTIIIGFKVIQYHRWRITPFLTELFVSLIAFTLIAQVFFVATTFDIVVNIIVLILFMISGYFLVKSINRESKAKDEIEKLVKDLTEANEQLQVLDQRKSEFVKISAHHLKAPLTGIKGYASMILEGSFGRAINNDAHEAIQKIFDASERLVSIIEDFMDISNIESGKMEYDFKSVNLKKLIEGVLEEMKMVIEKSGLDVSFNTDAIDGYTLFADAGKLRQVISNLTDNAIKYTPQGHVHLFLKKDTQNKKLHFTITDTGIGMSKDTIDNLFEKFSRAHDANKVNTGGSGLGLYVAKEIMKKHEARIWIESPGEGKGSTFHLEFDSK